MDIRHLFSPPLQTNPCGLDPCINHNFFAMPLTKSTLGLWNINEVKQTIHDRSKPQHVELTGHNKKINAFAFTNGSKSQLASSCCEKMLLWDLEISGSEYKSKLFFSNPGELSVMGFNNCNTIIAAGKGHQVLIIKNGQSKVSSIFEGHSAMVTGVKFCPHYTATLVSISDDRTCCVWDIKDSLLLYQSPIISSAPLLSMTMSLLNPCVAMGSGDGKLIVFDLTNGHGFRQLVKMDIANSINKETEKKRKQDKSNNAEENETFAEASESILSIEYTYFSQNSDTFEAIFGQNVSAAGDILKDSPPSLNIMTTNFCVQINSRTLEIKKVINLKSTAMESEAFTSSLTVGSVSYATAKQINQIEMFIVTGTVFDRKIHILKWLIMNEYSMHASSDDVCDEDNNHLTLENDYELCIVATNALELNSPLKSEMLPPVAKGATTKGDIATGKKKPGGKMSQPLTFKSTIRSSGYTQAPRTTMFKPQTNKQKLLNLSAPVKKTPLNKTIAGKILKSVSDTTSWHVKDYIDTFQVDNQTSAVFNLRFTDDGTALACALSNKTAMIIKAPFSRHICSSFIGHNHTVNSVYWSNCNSYLLTASSDKTVRLWEKSSGDPFMVMTHKKSSPKDGVHNQNGMKKSMPQSQKPNVNSSCSSTTLSLDSNNKLFSKEITRAQFYYMDKFILVTNGCDLSLFKYHVSPDVDDLKRYQTRNRYKLVENWATQSSSFTYSTAVNNFFSHLVLCTTSGKCIEIYDTNKSSLSHSFPDCHSRPPHCIVINEGSCFSSQSSQAYNVFATIAPTDPIKLWDLRSKSCVQALVGHQNKAHACQIAFSPCGNYLASGSEDRAIYLFDLRKGTFCEKLKGPSNVVTSVAFNPAKPLLAAGSLDSEIMWYK